MNATARAHRPEESASPTADALATSLRAAAPANDPAPAHAIVRRASRAIEERRVCVIRYASEPGGGPTTRTIEPLAIVSTRGALGLLAWCRLRRDLRTFRVDRIASIALGPERFVDHPGVALERFIQRRRRALP